MWLVVTQSKDDNTVDVARIALHTRRTVRIGAMRTAEVPWPGGAQIQAVLRCERGRALVVDLAGGLHINQRPRPRAWLQDDDQLTWPDTHPHRRLTVRFVVHDAVSGDAKAALPAAALAPVSGELTPPPHDAAAAPMATAPALPEHEPRWPRLAEARMWLSGVDVPYVNVVLLSLAAHAAVLGYLTVFTPEPAKRRERPADRAMVMYLRPPPVTRPTEASLLPKNQERAKTAKSGAAAARPRARDARSVEAMKNVLVAQHAVLLAQAAKTTSLTEDLDVRPAADFPPPAQARGVFGPLAESAALDADSPPDQLETDLTPALVAPSPARSVAPVAPTSAAAPTVALDARSARDVGLTWRVIEREVRRHDSQVRFCYERQLAQNDDLAGKVVLRWLVGPDGTVGRVDIGQSTLANFAVESCLAAAVWRWSFPPFSGVTPVWVEYPFYFTAR
jgi:hypothetical protein